MGNVGSIEILLNHCFGDQDMTDALRRAVQRCHQCIWRQLIHPELGLIYDYAGPDGDGREPFWWLPTADEIARRYPNPQGWSTGMEDSSLSGGFYLDTMLRAYGLTGHEAYAEKARRLYHGLLRTGTCSPEKGYIARGLTYDNAHWYPASSVDQYTSWIYGMWRYAHSEIAKPDEARAIGTVIRDVCTRAQRDDWALNREDGEPSYYTDIGSFTSDRSTRLLELLLVAHDLTGEQAWYDLYRQKLEEQDFKRLESVQDQAAMSPTPYVAIQTAASLLPLMQLEKDEAICHRYTSAMNACGRGMWYTVPACYQYDQTRIEAADWDPDWRGRYPPGGFRKGGVKFEPPGWTFEDMVIRRPCEAMIVVLLSADTDPYMDHGAVRDQLRRVVHWALSTYDYERLHSYGLVYAEALYWLAVEKQLIDFDN